MQRGGNSIILGGRHTLLKKPHQEPDWPVPRIRRRVWLECDKQEEEWGRVSPGSQAGALARHLEKVGFIVRRDQKPLEDVQLGSGHCLQTFLMLRETWIGGRVASTHSPLCVLPASHVPATGRKQPFSQPARSRLCEVKRWPCSHHSASQEVPPLSSAPVVPS